MRERKYRVWVEKTQKLYPVLMLGFNNITGSLETIQINTCGEYFNVEGKLIEYTGLCDKNGKDIYEGEIIELTTDEGEKEIGEIYYNDEEYQWEISWNNEVLNDFLEYYRLSNIDPYEIESIGNIYENPELLEQS